MLREKRASCAVELSEGEWLELGYHLIVDEACWGHSYGIAVSDSLGEEVLLRYLTLERQEAEDLLARMAQGQVTTVTAADVVEDFLSEL